jgi:hypothetical protein
VTISSQPQNPAQACTISNASGFVGMSNVTDIAVSCPPVPVFIDVTVLPGRVGNGITISDDVGDSQLVTPASFPDGGAYTFEFPTAYSSAQTFTVNVATPDTCTLCTATPASGAFGGTNVHVTVTCSLNPIPRCIG